ncbi:MAG: LLM class flavin-dependent oxidoreductase [Ktedonobacteraceae bacterium]|nr:LLM class flavin-dependent oxidoreductase [Ktedonobacteraceae bacterium]
MNQPKGVQQPHLPLLVAGKGEQVTLKLVAQYADACNLTHPTPEELIHKFALIDRYCEALGRDAREIRRTIYVKGFVGATDAEAMEQAQHASKKFPLDQQRIRGLLGVS